MMQITPEELVEFVRGREDLRLTTIYRKEPFIARTAGDGLEFVPGSTEKPRYHSMKYVALVCERFGSLDSPWHPGDYHDLTANASYQLAVMDAYLTRPIQSVSPTESAGAASVGYLKR